MTTERPISDSELRGERRILSVCPILQVARRDDSTNNHISRCYVMLLLNNCKNTSSCPILVDSVWTTIGAPSSPLTFTALCGSPSQRRTPRCPEWGSEHCGDRLAVQPPSSRTLCPLHLTMLCANRTDFFFNQNNAALSHYCPSAKHKWISNFSLFPLLNLKIQLLPSFAVRTPYWFQLFHYLKWIYSCLQWQINSVSSAARCLASGLWGNHKPLGR